MCGRENLIWEYSEDVDAGTMVYISSQANEVMDRMEAKIKKLEKEIKRLKQDLVVADTLLVHY